MLDLIAGASVERRDPQEAETLERHACGEDAATCDAIGERAGDRGAAEGSASLPTSVRRRTSTELFGEGIRTSKIMWAWRRSRYPRATDTTTARFGTVGRTLTARCTDRGSSSDATEVSCGAVRSTAGGRSACGARSTRTARSSRRRSSRGRAYRTVVEPVTVLGLLTSFDTYDQLHVGWGLSAGACGRQIVAIAKSSLLADDFV
jgi:hypothetical protein